MVPGSAGRLPQPRRLAGIGRLPRFSVLPWPWLAQLGNSAVTTEILLGVDIGTTDSKVLVTGIEGTEILSAATPSRWTNHDGRYTDMPAEDLARTVLDLLERAVLKTTAELGPVRVSGIGVTAMGEAGVLLDEHSHAVFPIIAWFDPRGAEEMSRFPAEVLEQFWGRTGLPVSPTATVAKLAWMRRTGVDFTRKTWLNIAEYVVYRLGGDAATELSLLARTGLLDQDTEALWPAAVAAVGASPELVPPRVLAGTPLGRSSNCHGPVPKILHGAVLTVAGHDHPVAAIGCGVLGADELFDSFGTAEALVQTVPGELDYAARERLARNGIDVVHHVLAGRRALIGGTKAGLLLRRTLRLLGADDSEGRSRLDRAVMNLPPSLTPLPGLEVRGAANSDGILKIVAARDDITPATLWRATLDHAMDEARACLARMAQETGPVSATVVAGGWIGMRSVRTAKQLSLTNVRFSTRAQAGAFGAALFAAHAVDQADQMTATGDNSAVGLSRPTGPDARFAADFGRLQPRSTPARHKPPQHQETVA